MRRRTSTPPARSWRRSWSVAAPSWTPPTCTAPAPLRRSSAAGWPNTPRTRLSSCSRPKAGSRWARAPTTWACPAATCARRSTPRCGGSGWTTSTSTRCMPGTRSRRSRRPCGSSTTRSATGKISYYGFSNYLGWQVTKAVATARAHGWAAPVTLQPQYNLLVRGIEHEIVPACLDAGIGLLPWSPLAGGWLTGKYRRDVTADRRDPAGRRPRARDGGLGAAQRPGPHLGDRRGGGGRRAELQRQPGAGGPRLAARPARRHLGHPRRPHGRAAARQPRGSRARPRHRAARPRSTRSAHRRWTTTRTARSGSTSATATSPTPEPWRRAAPSKSGSPGCVRAAMCSPPPMSSRR